MHMHRRFLVVLGFLVCANLSATLSGCGGSAPAPRSPETTATAGSTQPGDQAASSPEASYSRSEDASPAPPPNLAAPQYTSPQPSMAAPSAKAAPLAQPASPAIVAPGRPPSSSGAARARASEALKEDASAQTNRPGLATQFGEDLERNARRAVFERQSMRDPFLTATFWYNDNAGAEAMARSARMRSGERAEISLLNGGLVVAISDEWFRVLNGFVADSRPYAIGEPNARYAIRVFNRTDFAFEVVASVDGLNVIDGRPASLERRGYILAPHDTVTIEGFRTSESTIAAFRFGKVSESYTVQMGHGDRNVGVIGIALFQERGKTPYYPSNDTQLRQDANPFPGEYSPRPKGR